MKEFLSLIISACVLFTSITPSFSQVYSGAGKALSNMAKVGELSSATNSRMLANIRRSVISQTSHIGLDIAKAISIGRIEGMSTRIVNLEITNSFRAPLLRNEFVKLSLLKVVPVKELKIATQFYKTDLQTRVASFQPLKGKLLEDVLVSTSVLDLFNYSNAMADVAALSLTGGKDIATNLVQFHKESVGGAFEDATTVIVARGLLRVKAYDAFNKWVAGVKQEGAFWQGIERYCAENSLPVTLDVKPGQDFTFPTLYENFLKAGNELNVLNASTSYESTKQWIELSEKDIHFEAETAEENAATVATNNPTTATELPALEGGISIGTQDLSGAGQIAIAPQIMDFEVAAEQAFEAVSLLEKPATEVATTSSNSGILYSGIPVFAIGKAVKNLFTNIRNRFKKEPHYDFNLTVADAEGVESTLPVNLSIEDDVMRGAKKEGYDRITFAFNPRFHNGYIAEFRNGTHAPKTMGHFHMRLRNNQVGLLVDLVKKYGNPNEPFRLKIEKRPDVNYKSDVMRVYDLNGNMLPLDVEVPVKEISKDSKIVLLEDGSLGVIKKGKNLPEPLSDFYVRLPKNQINTFVGLLPHSPESFDISLQPTKDRTNILVRDVSLTSVGIGKTMGPIVKGPLGISVSASTNLMFLINYVFPGFASLLTPALKKYGEKKLLTLSMLMSTASGTLAALAGFHGSIDGVTVGPLQKGLFITALFLLSGAGILKQLVTNMLIKANQGNVVLDKAVSEVTTAEKAAQVPQLQGFAQLKNRMQNLYASKPDVNFKDVILYNMSFIYKNIGALTFLSFPFILNGVSKLLTGTSLGLDFSASFPLLAAYSGYTTLKVMRAKLRDAYSAKNLIESGNTLTNALDNSVEKLLDSHSKGMVTHTDIDDVARSIKNAMDDLTFATLKMNPEQVKKEIFNGLKENSLDILETRLVEGGLNPDEAHSLVVKVTSSLNKQGNVFKNLVEICKLPGVLGLSAAMTLATVHEFVISSSFTSTLKDLSPQGEYANFILALSLYLPLIVGRLGGNFVSRYLSSGSMYLLCSGLSSIGTGIMMGAGDSVTQTVVGAAVASLGVGNFFTQMYDFIMKKYPKHNRELSAVLALTMGIAGFAAMPAGWLASSLGANLDLGYAALALAGSLALTPSIMANSTLFQVGKFEWNKFTSKVKSFFKGGKGNGNPSDLDGAVPAN